jgi:hypothetical protein
MTEENNTTADMIGIPTTDGVKNVDPELLKKYKDEAFDYLHNVEHNNTLFKELVDTISETTDIPKKDIRGWLKARYADKVKALKQQSLTMEALDAAVEG